MALHPHFPHEELVRPALWEALVAADRRGVGAERTIGTSDEMAIRVADRHEFVKRKNYPSIRQCFPGNGQ
jgi:hypothetical protein